MPRCRNLRFLETGRPIEPRQPAPHLPYAPVGRSIFRILTEEINVDRLKATLVGLGLDFTLFHAQGCWHGRKENSLAIEFDDVSRHRAEEVARIIKSMNNQEAVLLQEIPVNSILI